MIRRMPPAVFPAIMGLFGLGLALRRGAEAGLLPAGAAEAVLGAVSLLWVCAAGAYLAKLMYRPGAVIDDMGVLPGRDGLAAAVLGGLFSAAAMEPHAPGLARVVLATGLMAHAGLALLHLRFLAKAVPEARGVTPVWHLSFVGFIVGGLSAAPLGWPSLGAALLWATMPVAAGVWGAGLLELARRVPPAPLRPLLATHLAPACLFGLVALTQGMVGMAQGFAVLASLILLALLAFARWLTAAGFSALWGAFTFPLAAYAGLCLGLQGPWLWPGVVALVAALGIVPWIAARVLRMWTNGTLAARTNAAAV